MTLIARDTPDGVKTHIKGEACGKVEFLFFSVEGCVDIEIGSKKDLPPIPTLVKKLSIKNRSPALAMGTAAGSPVDAALGDGIASDSQPLDDNENWVTVPIDAIPILSLELPPKTDQLKFNGQSLPASAGSPGLPASGFATKGADEYAYDLKGVNLERMSPAGPALIGSHAPATWQISEDPSDPQPSAALALLTWEPTPAPKIFEKSEKLDELVKHRWGRTCDRAAPPTSVFWTFRLERLGPSNVGWDLEGIAWPDPLGAKRSVPPGTSLRVTERWRSTNADLDQRRGVQPAIVINGFVECARPSSNSAAARAKIVRVGGLGPLKGGSVSNQGRLISVGDPALDMIVRRSDLEPFRITERFYDKATAAHTGAPAPFDLYSAISQWLTGGAVSAGDLVGSLLDPKGTRRMALNGRACEVRLLQSPRFDDGRFVVFGSDPDGAIERAVKEAMVTHGPLDEVVEIETGSFDNGVLLLFVLRALVEKRVVMVRTLNDQGAEFSMIPATKLVSSLGDLPTHWGEATGPWFDDATDLMQYRSEAAKNGYVPVLLQLRHGEKAASIEIGVLPDSLDADSRPPFLVAAIELQALAEVQRAEWDESETKKSQETLVKVLGPTPTDDAMLFPDSVYRVNATWSAVRKGDPNPVGDTTQSYWFKTQASAPDALDPWVLITRPEDGEAGVFGEEPLRIAFNTHDVDRLFAAYGQELRIRIQAASGAHPKPKPNVPHPWVIADDSLVRVGPAMLSPWEESLVSVMDGRCAPIDENRNRHTVTVIPMPLDPYTDYLLDVEMVKTGDPASAVGTRIFRRRFSTGAYGLLKSFAAAFQASKPSARGLDAGSVESIRNFFAGRQPQGAEFDERLRTVGIEARATSAGTRITTIWETVAGVPQPAGVLIEAAEPIWRERRIPTKVVDNDSEQPVERYQLLPRPWLTLSPTPGGDPIVAANGEIRAPGGSSALIALVPGARGKRLRLDLVRLAEPESYLVTTEERFTIIDIEFASAPWED